MQNAALEILHISYNVHPRRFLLNFVSTLSTVQVLYDSAVYMDRLCYAKTIPRLGVHSYFRCLQFFTVFFLLMRS